MYGSIQEQIFGYLFQATGVKMYRLEWSGHQLQDTIAKHKWLHFIVYSNLFNAVNPLGLLEKRIESQHYLWFLVHTRFQSYAVVMLTAGVVGNSYFRECE